jgi:hypothetical protein
LPDRPSSSYVCSNEKGETKNEKNCRKPAVPVVNGGPVYRLRALESDLGLEGKKILVYAVLKSERRRRIVEDEFVAHFKYRGLNAVPGYIIFPGEELAKKEVLEEKLRSQGFDTLLLTQVTGTKKELVQVPGTATYQPLAGQMYQPTPNFQSYPGYYSVGYQATYTPSYTVEDNYVMTETSLFDVASEKMIWSGAGVTLIGDKDQQMIKDYVAMMMDAIRKDKIVP